MTLVKIVVSEKTIASIIRVTRIDELGTTLPVSSNRSTLLFLQEPHGVTSQKTAFLDFSVFLLSPAPHSLNDVQQQARQHVGAHMPTREERLGSSTSRTTRSYSSVLLICRLQME
jgi:hypothetical protein